MKKSTILFLCFIMCFAFFGCQAKKEAFVFDDLGFEVKMQLGAHTKASCNDTSVLITHAENEESFGGISVSKTEGKNLNEIYDTYIVGDGEITKTQLSEQVIFVDVVNEVDSVILGTYVDRAYCFIFYDENTGAVLYGRFFETCERDDVINLAKSIEVIKR